MKLEAYIQELLYQKDHVVIPGFGAFITNYQPAQIQESRQAILPPSKKIAFNPDLQSSDAHLAHQITIEENLGFVEATNKIENKVQAWKNQLWQEQTLELKGIGTLYMDEGHNIRFTPSPDQNFLISCYGLKEVHAKPIKKAVKQKPARSKKPQKTRKRVTLYPQTTKGISIAATLAIFFLASLLVFILPPVQNHQEGNLNVVSSEQSEDKNTSSGQHPETNNNEEAGFTGEDEKTHPSNEANPDTEANSSEALANSTSANKAANKNLEDQTSTSSTTYHVITGSFKNKNNAVQYKQYLNEIGYNPQLLNTGKGVVRVSVERLSDHQNIMQKLKNLRLKVKSSAWLLKE